MLKLPHIYARSHDDLPARGKLREANSLDTDRRVYTRSRKCTLKRSKDSRGHSYHIHARGSSLRQEPPVQRTRTWMGFKRRHLTQGKNLVLWSPLPKKWINTISSDSFSVEVNPRRSKEAPKYEQTSQWKSILMILKKVIYIKINKDPWVPEDDLHPR